MPTDLVVASGTTVVLDERTPPPQLASDFQRIEIRTLDDLVKNGVVRSRANLDQLLGAAKKVTVAALSNRDTFRITVRNRELARPNLQRFSSFLSETPTVSPLERTAFWRIAREIEPLRIASVNHGTDLSANWIKIKAVPKILINISLADVTVQSGAILKLGGFSSKVLNCNHLTIKKSGRIICEGSGVLIRAKSLLGEQ